MFPTPQRMSLSREDPPHISERMVIVQRGSRILHAWVIGQTTPYGFGFMFCPPSRDDSCRTSAGLVHKVYRTHFTFFSTPYLLPFVMLLSPKQTREGRKVMANFEETQFEEPTFRERASQSLSRLLGNLKRARKDDQMKDKPPRFRHHNIQQVPTHQVVTNLSIRAGCTTGPW